MTTIDQRVAHLEFRVDTHGAEIASLRNDQTALNKSLRAIETYLLQIKWALYGGGFMFVAHSLGLPQVLTKIFHL